MSPFEAGAIAVMEKDSAALPIPTSKADDDWVWLNHSIDVQFPALSLWPKAAMMVVA